MTADALDCTWLLGRMGARGTPRQVTGVDALLAAAEPGFVAVTQAGSWAFAIEPDHVRGRRSASGRYTYLIKEIARRSRVCGCLRAARQPRRCHNHGLGCPWL
jgi:hypothetical protein